MKKKEIVCRELLLSSETTQLELSRILDVSLSTVNNAIRPLRDMGAVQVTQRKAMVVDREKILLYWASMRKLHEDVVYESRVDLPAGQIEKNMPAGILFTAYSGYRFRFREVPADYSEVYVYAQGKALDSLAKRFPKGGGPSNLFALRTDERLHDISKDGIVPDSQLFVDLWNLPEWYAKEFVVKMKERML